MTQEGQFLMSSPDQFLMSFDTVDLNPFAPLGQMLARHAEAARWRRDLKRLSAMPEYLLRDIGLHRGDIADTGRRLT